MVLQTVIEPASAPLGMDGIYNKLLEVEEALNLNEDEKKTLPTLKLVLKLLKRIISAKVVALVVLGHYCYSQRLQQGWSLHWL